MLACAWATAPVEAHEIGTTAVTVHLDASDVASGTGRGYTIVVATDADALVEKLEAMADRPAGERGAASVAARLAALEETFRGRVWVQFDGKFVRPAVSFSVAAPKDEQSPSVATVRLSGDVPAAAERFAWSYGWTFSAYSLTVTEAGVVARASGADGGQSEDGNRVTQWLEGGEPSAAFMLGTPVRRPRWADIARQYVWLGFTYIAPKSLYPVVFAVGLFLLNRRWRSRLWQVPND